ncbi:MAG: 4Fe-4S binding protein [Negativicutes bacterium]|nr:4Fe-4S binding protein [Negativicutes bacterium]
MNFDGKDQYLEERMARFDQWKQEGKIPASSKVIPLQESLFGLQWVLPTQQVVELLRNLRTLALTDCTCRTRYNRCDNPRDICILTNDMADRWVAEGRARHIGIEEAKDRLKAAHEHGLVHLSFYNPDQYIYALCSCCACCCHDLQILKKYQRPDFVVHADYVAEVDKNVCSGCGACVKRCVFGAQERRGGTVVFQQDQCYGCGVCVTTCPAGAIRMRLRAQPAQTGPAAVIGR